RATGRPPAPAAGPWAVARVASAARRAAARCRAAPARCRRRRPRRKWHASSLERPLELRLAHAGAPVQVGTLRVLVELGIGASLCADVRMLAAALRGRHVVERLRARL